LRSLAFAIFASNRQRRGGST